MNTFIHNIITNSQGKNDICMSEEVEKAMKGLRSFMFKSVYTNPVAKREEHRAMELVERLFYYYMEHVEKMPVQYRNMLSAGEKKERVVCDYIAGMTDQYAIAKFEEIFVPKAWQVDK